MNSQKPRIPSVLDDPELRAIARVYAVAFLDSAVNHQEVLEEFVSFVNDVLEVQPALETALTSQIINKDEKRGILERIVKPYASTGFYNLLCVILGHERLELLRLVLDEALIEQDSRAGRQKVKLISATPLNSDQLSNIAQQLQGKLSIIPELVNVVDNNILGGLIIQIGDSVFDSSLRARLNQMTSQLRMRYLHEIQSGRDRFSPAEGN
jgi:F-type H+-transporting ATPase subunit delta